MNSRVSPRAWASALALLLAACNASNADNDKATKADAPKSAVEVDAATVRVADMPLRLNVIGSLRANETADIAPEVAGRISQIGFREGQSVRKGQLLFQLEDSVYRAQRDQSAAGLEIARSNLKRAREMAERHMISSQSLEESQSTVDQQAANLRLYEAQLKRLSLVAPFDGVAGLRQVSPGDFVAVGQTLVTVQGMDPLKAEFRVPEQYLAQLKPGLPIQLRVDTYADQVFNGKIFAVDATVGSETRTINVRATLPNPDKQLKPGQFARVALELPDTGKSLAVPEEAVFPLDNRNYVYLIRDGVVEQREVQIGTRIPGTAQVLDGLAEGDAIITEGLQKVSPGDNVRIRSLS